jgi:hypothetical protein
MNAIGKCMLIQIVGPGFKVKKEQIDGPGIGWELSGKQANKKQKNFNRFVHRSMTETRSGAIFGFGYSNKLTQIHSKCNKWHRKKNSSFLPYSIRPDAGTKKKRTVFMTIRNGPIQYLNYIKIRSILSLPNKMNSNDF